MSRTSKRELRAAWLAAVLTCGVASGCGDDGAGGSGGAGTGGTASSSASSAGQGGASSSSSGAGGEGGSAPSGKVAAFVAQGHVGTTLLSCDDGRSWVAHRAFDAEAHALVCGEAASVRCFSGACEFRNGAGDCVTQASDCDCDHHPGSGKGLAYGDGAFVATFGWGQPGVVLRSTNGVDWAEVASGATYADVAAGNGRIALAERTPVVSTDGGLSFAPTTDANHAPWNVRRLFYLPQSQQFLQAAASGDSRDLRFTSDFQAWTSPLLLPAACLGLAEAAEAGGVIVTRGPSLCRSLDGGGHFSVQSLPGNADLFSGPIHDGEKFLAWGFDGGLRVYTSVDGATWSSEATNLSGGDRFGEVARNPVTGTLVAARDQWQAWYEQQRWYRSADGVTWEVLSAADGPATHPIRELAFGYVDPSEACPVAD